MRAEVGGSTTAYEDLASTISANLPLQIMVVIALSLALYVLIGLCWLPVVVLQIRMRDLAEAADVGLEHDALSWEAWRRTRSCAHRSRRQRHRRLPSAPTTRR